MAGSFHPQSSENTLKHALTQRGITGLCVSVPRHGNLVLFPRNLFGCLNIHDQARSLKNRKVKMERKCTLTLAPELHAGIRGGGKRWFPSEGLTHSATPWLKPSRKQTFLKATYKQVTSFKWIKVFLLRKRWTHRFAIPYENRRTLQLSSTDKSRPTCRKQERRWQFSFSVQHVCSKILILRTLNIFSIYFARSTQYFRNTFFPMCLIGHETRTSLQGEQPCHLMVLQGITGRLSCQISA